MAVAAAGVTFNAWALEFSPQTINTTSAVQTLVLTNPGTLTLAITQIAATGDFAETDTCGTSLRRALPAILVTFKPTAIGAVGTIAFTTTPRLASVCVAERQRAGHHQLRGLR